MIKKRAKQMGRKVNKESESILNKKEVIQIIEYCKDIPNEIKLNNKIIKNLEDQHYTLPGVAADGQPRGKGGISNPVEAIVMNMPKGVSELIKKYEDKTKLLDKLYKEIMREIGKLSYRERKVIYGFYIEDLRWEKIAPGFYSIRQCKNIRNIAIDKLSEQFLNNQFIQKNMKGK